MSEREELLAELESISQRVKRVGRRDAAKWIDLAAEELATCRASDALVIEVARNLIRDLNTAIAKEAPEASAC